MDGTTLLLGAIAAGYYMHHRGKKEEHQAQEPREPAAIPLRKASGHANRWRPGTAPVTRKTESRVNDSNTMGRDFIRIDALRAIDHNGVLYRKTPKGVWKIEGEGVHHAAY